MLDKLSVLIPTRNRPKVLEEAFKQMYQHGLGDLYYLIYDDASDDPQLTVEACSQICNVTILKGKTRVGQAQGRNILLRECATPYAVLMDDDTWFTETSSLNDLIERDLFYQDIGRATAVCSQVFRTTDGVTIFPENASTKRILSPLGMGCIVRKDDILRVGGFRSFFQYRHEETELGLRLWEQDLPVVYDPSLVIAHSHSDLARSSPEYDRLSARNLILMHALNLPGAAGLPLGIARALRLLLIPGVFRFAVVKGMVNGIQSTIHYRSEATVMSKKSYWELRQFLRQA